MNDAKPTCGWNAASPYRPTEKLAEYVTQEDVQSEMRHFDPSTPLEIVIISAVLKGLERFASDTADDEVADGFSGDDARTRSHHYYETRERLQTYWSRA